MDREDEIILSFYYKNPRNNPSKYSQHNRTPAMDLYQLFLIRYEVFREKRYELRMSGGEVIMYCLPEYEREYIEMFLSENMIYREAKVLDVHFQEKHKILMLDKRLRELETSEKIYFLYFDCILVNAINSKKFVFDRKDFHYFRVFSAASHRNVVDSISTMCLWLTEAYSKNGEDAARTVIATLNQDYKTLQDIYTDRNKVILDMIRRVKFFWEDCKRSNEETKVVNWKMQCEQYLKRQLKEEKGMIGDIIYEAKNEEIWLKYWILYIAELAECLNLCSRSEIGWNDSLEEKKPYDRPMEKMFTKLRENLKLLEKRDSVEFDWDQWQISNKMYIKELLYEHYWSK